MPGQSKKDNSAGSRGGEDKAFLEDLGNRVRTTRARRGLSRKLLAQTAGVSERYLAQLETGQGNISILLLRHVAAALDLGLEDLVAEDPQAGTEITAILQLLRRADAEARDEVKQILLEGRRGQATRDRSQCLALIGLRGAGKSTLGPLIAADLGMPFIELNDMIAEMSGLSVPEIFNLYGQEGYRRLERRCLQEAIDGHDRVVLTSGGGIVADPATFEILLASFFTVWLRAAPEEHMARVRAQGDLRPMAGSDEAMGDLKLILDSREALYTRADRTFDTSARSVEACRKDLTASLKADGFVAA